MKNISRKKRCEKISINKKVNFNVTEYLKIPLKEVSNPRPKIWQKYTPQRIKYRLSSYTLVKSSEDTIFGNKCV